MRCAVRTNRSTAALMSSDDIDNVSYLGSQSLRELHNVQLHAIIAYLTGLVQIIRPPDLARLLEIAIRHRSHYKFLDREVAPRLHDGEASDPKRAGQVSEQHRHDVKVFDVDHDHQIGRG